MTEGDKYYFKYYFKLNKDDVNFLQDIDSEYYVLHHQGHVATILNDIKYNKGIFRYEFNMMYDMIGNYIDRITTDAYAYADIEDKHESTYFATITKEDTNRINRLTKIMDHLKSQDEYERMIVNEYLFGGTQE